MKKSIRTMITAALEVSFKNQQEGSVAAFNPTKANEDNVVISKQLLEVLMKKAFRGYQIGEFETPAHRADRIYMLPAKCTEHEEITDILREELTLQPIKDFIITVAKDGQE